MEDAGERESVGSGLKREPLLLSTAFFPVAREAVGAGGASSYLSVPGVGLSTTHETAGETGTRPRGPLGLCGLQCFQASQSDGRRVHRHL